MNSTTPHEDDLARALRGRVDGMTEAPFTVDDIAGRAGTIRRRRRIAVAGGVAAAVAAVVIPSAILSGSPDRADTPPVVDSPSAPQSVAPSGPQAFDVSDLPMGAAPSIAWVDGLTVHRADGSTVEVTGVDRIHQVAPLGTGWVVATDDTQGNLEAVLVDSSGAAGERFPLDGSLATSPDASVVAWVAPDGRVRAIDTTTGRVREHSTVEAPGPYSAVDVTGESCVRGPAGGCTVFVRTNGEKVATYTTYQDGGNNLVGGGMLAVTSVSPLWIAGITEFHDDLTTCSEVTNESDTMWETCDFRIFGFSPSGGHAVAVGSIGDGLGDRELAILDTADGTPLVHLQSSGPASAFSMDQVWEDDSHVLAVTWQDGEWAVVRVGLDGSMEYAVAPVPGSDTERPFFLQIR